MSSISTIYDTILSTLGTMFSTRTRIPNPYIIEENPIQLLRNGYGLKILQEAPATSEFCRFSRSRSLAITISKEVLSTELQTSAYDATVKALLEDAYTIQKDFLNPDQLGIESDIERIEMAGTGPIELLKGDKINILSMDILFIVQVTDDL